MVGAVGAPRNDDPERRRRVQHGADLHRARMRAQHRPRPGLAGEVEGVHLLARGMLGRNVEGGEIVPVVLDVRPLGPAEAHLAEYLGDLVDGLGDRVQAALRRGPDGERDVDPLFREAPFQLALRQSLLAGVDGVGDGLFQTVEGLAPFAPLFGRSLAQALHQLGDGAAAAERAHPHILQRLQAAGRQNGALQLVPERRQFVRHGRPSFPGIALRRARPAPAPPAP